ncbi:hypothetical protein Sjap_015636 [Stephania japonica]|uniref:Pentatricopeptide repeat-containing protein-mitochondrial domain-containing protein n=1 Tax=Stephania japonica TaxID=461633 RepID=A0AAP0IJK1_9MAGN
MRRILRTSCNQQLPIIQSNRHPQSLKSNPLHHHFSSSNFPPKDPSFTAKPSTPRSSNAFFDEINNTHILISRISPSTLSESVISKCSPFWSKKGETFTNPSLHTILIKLSSISPESVRRYWRVSSLIPKHVLEIVLGFDFVCENPRNESRKVALLWDLFNWASEQSESFEHEMQCCEVMASMLARIGSFREAESLVRVMETRGVLVGTHEILCKIVEGYANAGEIEESVSAFNWSRSRGIVPSEQCFRVVLGILVQTKRIRLAYRVCKDMIEVGFGLSNVENSSYERLIELLCKEGKVLQARRLVKNRSDSGIEPSCAVVNAIADGYCEKKDFEDILLFLNEVNIAPDPYVCNKILISQCRRFGTEEANLFMKELEFSGFQPDETTFGIFISLSCREGKLKDALVYLSEILSRGLKPDIHCYNALIGGMFKKGMWKQARDVFEDMLESGITPEVSTFRVLLAGYCKYRRFVEVKAVIEEMMKYGLIEMFPLEDPLSKAFSLLGFDPLVVKLKRDNGAELRKAEFFDALGNGLYLETDLDEYENALMCVLDDAIFPNFNTLIMNKCDHDDIEAALLVKEKMVCRGQKSSSSAYSALMKGLSVSRSHAMKAFYLFEEVYERTAQQLPCETLNLLIRSLCKRGSLRKGKIVLDYMVHRNLPVENETYTALIMNLQKKGWQKELRECWELARKDKWLPPLKDFKAIVTYLTHQGMLNEAIVLLTNMLESQTHMISDISDIFLEQLCDTGHAVIGHIIAEEVLAHGWVLNHTTYNYLVSGFLKEKRYQEAFGIFDAMTFKKVAPSMDVYNTLMPQLCRFHKFEKAMALKEIMLQEGEAPHALYCVLLNGLCRIGQIKLATPLFEEMSAKGVSPGADAYNALVLGYCLDNNSRKLGEVLGLMVRKSFSLTNSSYRHLVRMMCLQDRVSHALRLKEFLRGENVLQPLLVYNILLFRFLQTGNGALGLSLVDEMKSKGLELDEVSYNFLVCGFCKSEDVLRSMEFLNSMIGNNFRPSNRSLRMVIRHLCDHHYLEKAWELCRVMESRGWTQDSTVQKALVECLLSHGKLQEAENYLHRMEERGLIPENILYDVLIKRFSWYGKIKMAVHLLNTMLKNGRLPNSTSYDSVIQGFCACKSVNDAYDFHTEMLVRGQTPSVKSWDMLIYGLSANGQTAESERLLDSMVSSGQNPTRNTFQSVINGYYTQNNLKKASEMLHKMQQHGHVPDFRTHWTLISNLSNSKDKDSEDGGGFLSNLLSRSGFSWKKGSKG